MECGICLSNINKSCYGSCSHHYCFQCLIRWCKTNNKCPKCRCVINEIILDKEFDELLHRLKSISMVNDNRFINIDFGNEICNDCSIIDEIDEIDELLKINICYDDNLQKNQHLYISLTNNKGPGVLIKNVEKHGRAYHYGLRKNDIILYINNVPCINHKMAIDIIDAHDLSRKTMAFAIIRL